MTEMNFYLSAPVPQDGPFVIVGDGGGFTREQNGQLLGHFTIEVPPNSGHTMPVTVLSSTKQEAFAQMAALARGFARKDAAQAARHEELLNQIGWRYGGVHNRGGKTVVWLNEQKIELTKQDNKVVDFYANMYWAPERELRPVELGGAPHPVGRAALGGDEEGIGDPLSINREYRNIFGNANPHRDREPEKINALLNKAEVVFPGIRGKLCQGKTDVQNTLMTYRDMMKQLVEEYYDKATLAQRATMEGAARHLLDSPTMEGWQIRNKLLEDSAINTNTSLQLLSSIYPERNDPGSFSNLIEYRVDTVNGGSGARTAFGDGAQPRQNEQVMQTLEELESEKNVFPDLKHHLRVALSCDDNYLRDDLTYRDLMYHLVQIYYQGQATEAQRNAMENRVKDLLQNDQLTSVEIEAILKEDTPIGAPNSLQLLAHVYWMEVRRPLLSGGG